jgi:predicted DsbA family dithiol-disulfide isomerase
MTGKITVDVWTDLICPWCHLGERRLEQALKRFAHSDANRREQRPDVPVRQHLLGRRRTKDPKAA